uniref:Uncharacterized protein n=1 Tax=Anopheles maculatus TaxID=74869 RepID=A0A182SC05_9DIPT
MLKTDSEFDKIPDSTPEFRSTPIESGVLRSNPEYPDPEYPESNPDSDRSDPELIRQLLESDRSDSGVCFILPNTTLYFQQELNIKLEKGKLIVPIGNICFLCITAGTHHHYRLPPSSSTSRGDFCTS